MKTIEVSETTFNSLEAYRQPLGLSQDEALAEALKRTARVERFRRSLLTPNTQADALSEEEAMALADEAVAWARSREKAGENGKD